MFREAVVAAAVRMVPGEPAEGRKAHEEPRGIPRILGGRLDLKEIEKPVPHKEPRALKKPLGLGMA